MTVYTSSIVTSMPAEGSAVGEMDGTADGSNGEYTEGDGDVIQKDFTSIVCSIRESDIDFLQVTNRYELMQVGNTFFNF